MNRSDLPYEAVYGLKSLGRFENFKLAFKAIFDAIWEDIRKNKALSENLLLSATWVDTPSAPMMFPAARNKACENGWIKDGKWVDDPGEENEHQQSA